MRFDKFSFGSIRIDGVTRDYDVVIDGGEIRKRVLNDGHNLRPHGRHAARVLHLHRNRHTAENITAPPVPANHASPVRGFCRTVTQGGV